MMENLDKTSVWIVILALGAGSFLLRFVFIGLVGDRQMPEWLLRHLRYTAIAVLPALVAPLVIWPQATSGEMDPPRMIAAAVTLMVGAFTKNVLLAIALGAISLYAGLYFLA